ncbi:MAG TPA: nuclear transport factor 2 family protein [Solirubrobacteraceae bacterium]|nr:nuclear transport factor 2 family protein [Solirubrobacteraceae bacterium]
MPSSAATIQALYGALDRHDGEAAAACYTDDATFEDPAFGRLPGGAVKEMWRMLTERSADLSVTLTDHGVDDDGRTGWARWSATYTFTATGRSVLNEIDAEFEFADGLIRKQVDAFPLRRWGAQALGPKGAVLGLTPLLGRGVRRQARASLADYTRADDET